jgi:hypothetical protein
MAASYWRQYLRSRYEHDLPVLAFKNFFAQDFLLVRNRWSGCERLAMITVFSLIARFQFAIERFSIDTKNSGCLTLAASHRGQNGLDVIALKLF